MEALKIEHIAYDGPGGGATIHPVDTRYPPFKVTAEYVAKHGPRPGGYWVSYDGGAYFSFSPAKPFDEGYTLIPAPGSTGIMVTDPGHQSTLVTAAQNPMPPQGPAAQNLYPQQEDASTAVFDPDTHA